jgi:hypothetical protein
LISLELEPLWESKILCQYKRPGRFCKLDLRGHFLMLLLYYRHCITQEFVGMLFGLTKANVCRGIKKLEPLLAKVMSLPKRENLNSEEIQDLIIDATENQIERPKHDQWKYYSGKKKCHTVKTEIRVRQYSRKF